MLVEWHPDGRIYLRSQGKIVFDGTLDEAAAVLGGPLTALPSGVIRRDLNTDTGVVRDFGPEGLVAVSQNTWPEGAALAQKETDMLAAYKARLVKQTPYSGPPVDGPRPPIPPPSPAVQAIIDQMKATYTAQQARIQALSALASATPGSLTAVQRDQILLHLLKKEMGQ